MTVEQAFDIYAEAARLERRDEHEAARDHFLVASDALEEIGELSDAREARRRALQNHIMAWARRQWPAEEFYLHNVTPDQLARRNRRGRTSFIIRLNMSHFVRVSVGRTGRVRLDAEDRGRRWSI